MKIEKKKLKVVGARGGSTELVEVARPGGAHREGKEERKNLT
jgi:hypothetical protein